jgi:hypothetical protein
MSYLCADAKYASPHFHTTNILKLIVQSHEIGIGGDIDLAEKVTFFSSGFFIDA